VISLKGRSNEYYSSVAEVIYYTNINKSTIDPDNTMTDDLFIQRIEEFLLEASDYVEVYTKRNFNKEYYLEKIERVPPGIHGIVRRIVSDIVAQAVVRRDDVVFTNGDASILIEDTVFNSNIKEDLDKYVRVQRPRFFVLGVQSEVTKRYDESGVGRIDSDFIEVEVTEPLLKGSFVNLYTYEGTKTRLADSVLGRAAHGFVNKDYVVGDLAKIYLDGINTDVVDLIVGSDYVLGVSGGFKRVVSSEDIIMQRVGWSVGVDKLKINFSEVTRRA
jgi:hypothetical protein